MWRKYVVKGVLVTLLSIGTVVGFAAGGHRLKHHWQEGGWRHHGERSCSHHGRSHHGGAWDTDDRHGCCPDAAPQVDKESESGAPKQAPTTEE